jgi:hypothetical protein
MKLNILGKDINILYDNGTVHAIEYFDVQRWYDEEIE